MDQLIFPNNVISALPQNLSGLFNNINYIPNYQRDFVWSQLQTQELWSDFIEHYKKNIDEKESFKDYSGYFLGAMVSIVDFDAKDIKREWDEIVDGQQRLTSLSIIAAVCYEQISLIKDIEEDVVDSWKAQLREILAKPSSGRFESKLKFSNSDIQEFFFKSLFENKTSTKRESYWLSDWVTSKISKKKNNTYTRIIDAIRLGSRILEDFLNSAPKEFRSKRLLNFINMLLSGIVILKIKAISYSNAYVIFESLNNRGVSLSQTDLVKNEVLKKVDDSDVSTVAANWEIAKNNVDNTEKKLKMTEFVHYSYMSRRVDTKEQIKEKYLFDNIRKSTPNAAAAKKYVLDLKADSEALISIIKNPKSDWGSETLQMLEDVNLILKNKYCYPYLICVYRVYKNDKDAFHAHVKALINFTFRYSKIIKASLSSFTNEIADACTIINNHGDIDQVKNHFKSKATDQLFKESFKKSNFKDAKFSYYILNQIEKTLLNGTTPLPHSKTQHVEHIMPKEPNPDKWPYIYKLKQEDHLMFRNNLWKIGNLIPLPSNINQSIKNNGIREKISAYISDFQNLKSPKTLSEFLDSDGEWSYESIEKRQNYLADELITKAWPL